MKQKASWNLDRLGMLIKRLIYIVGFVWLCYLDHIIGSATGYIQYALKNYTGVVIAVMILTAYKLKDFIKLPYLLWIVIFLIGKWGILSWADGRVYELGRLEASIWNVGFYGLIMIRLIYAWCLERKYPHMNWPLFGLWLLMMIGMVVIRPDITWTRWFLVFFGCFYMTEFSEEDLNNLYSGMLEGIIVGFLLLQTYACMFRPYDMLRYEGMYSNSNMNALFYLLTYGAVLGKWYQMKLKGRAVWLRLPIVALAGILIALTFFTMGRTALISIIILTGIFLSFQAISRKRGRLKILLIDAGAIVIASVICFVPTYYAVRYIPAYVNEPLFFEADMNKLTKKIQKGDSMNSGMYTDLETVLEKSFGRLFWFLKDEEEILWKERGVLVAMLPGEAADMPLFTKEEAEDPVRVRTGIYKYYIENSRLIGQRTGVQDLWLTSNYSAPHAHNIFLHIVGEFGWIIGGMFGGMVVLAYLRIIVGIRAKRQGKWYFRLFVTTVFTTVAIAFGMLEICWTFGQLTFTMLFLVQYLTVRRIPDDKKVQKSY
ncbi:MAG: hypothetical protein IJX63_08740 [Lachnospiraceae bacterium]|nr:hypothetical protein [Lachnospiraceae bacterium]